MSAAGTESVGPVNSEISGTNRLSSIGKPEEAAVTTVNLDSEASGIVVDPNLKANNEEGKPDTTTKSSESDKFNQAELAKRVSDKIANALTKKIVDAKGEEDQCDGDVGEHDDEVNVDEDSDEEEEEEPDSVHDDTINTNITVSKTVSLTN